MKKFIIILFMVLMPIIGQAGGCDKYNVFHSTQAHPTTICTCESCHLGSLNKGTAPTTCVGCHMGARPAAPQKPPSHLPTSNIGCENCHGVSTFLSARMNHNVVSALTCSSCHVNNAVAPKKPSNHIITTADCSSCHKTSSWDASMNHTGVTTGCASCHIQDKRSNHIPTVLGCESCHTSTTWSSGRYTHTGTENCTQCHANSAISGVTQKGPTHPITIQNCLSCHSGTVTFSCAMNNIELFVKKVYAYIITNTLFS